MAKAGGVEKFAAAAGRRGEFLFPEPGENETRISIKSMD